jgi:ribosomal 30S subunit maturation factor RimM
MLKDGRVMVRLKSKNTQLQNEFRLSSPESISIFSATANPGSTFDLGTFKAGMRLTFALETSEGYTYYTDQIQNRDFFSHVRKVPTGPNKWELRWEDVFGLGDRDYNDLVVEVEAIPTSNDDVKLLQNSRVVAKMVSRGTPHDNEFWLSKPVSNKIFDCTKENMGKSFEVGSFSAGTIMGFALKTEDGKTYHTDSTLNPDARVHVIKLALGSNKWQMRWEDLYDLKDRDYNDLVVQLTIYPKV